MGDANIKNFFALLRNYFDLFQKALFRAVLDAEIAPVRFRNDSMKLGVGVTDDRSAICFTPYQTAHNASWTFCPLCLQMKDCGDTIVVLEGTSLITIAPAPMCTSSPMVIGPKISAPTPI
jgi:hypothetical protein